MESLVGLTTVSGVRLKLEPFKREPGGLDGTPQDRNSNALDKAYDDAVDRINFQGEKPQELATKALSGITGAKRPITTLELQHALAVKLRDIELDEDNIPETDDITSVCFGLVTVDEETDIIRLVHYTTQEYFEKNRTSFFPDGECPIVDTCITYLSFDAFGTAYESTVE
jgi:hypothetical protein